MRPLLLFFILGLGLQIPSQAGCGGICLSDTMHFQWPYNDSVTIQQGDSTTFYARFDGCCASLLGANINVVWYLNGVPIDTTQLWSVQGYYYYHQLTVHDTGHYQVMFFGYPPSYTCGDIDVYYGDPAVPTLAPHPSLSLSLSLSPNPGRSHSTLRLSSPVEQLHVVFYDMSGREAGRTTTLNETDFILSEPMKGSGIYFYRIFSNELEISSGKFVFIAE